MEAFHLVRTSIIFRECVCVDDVKSTDSRQLVAFNEILPFTLQDVDTRLFIPSQCPHMPQDIRMRLDDRVLRRFSR